MRNFTITSFLILLVTNSYAASNIVCGVFKGSIVFGNDNQVARVVFDLDRKLKVIELEGGIKYESDWKTVKFKENRSFDIQVTQNSTTLDSRWVKLGFSGPDTMTKTMVPVSVFKGMKSSDSMGIEDYEDEEKSGSLEQKYTAVCYYTGEKNTAPFEHQVDQKPLREYLVEFKSFGTHPKEADSECIDKVVSIQGVLDLKRANVPSFGLPPQNFYSTVEVATKVASLKCVASVTDVKYSTKVNVSK